MSYALGTGNQDVVPAIKETPFAQYQKWADTLTELSKLPNWGNGRDIKNVAKSISSAVFASIAPGTTILPVGPSDILRELEAMLEAQRARCARVIDSTSTAPLPRLTSGPPDPIRTTTSQTTKKEKDPTLITAKGAEPQETSNATRTERSVERDPGVTDKIWLQLQADIAAEESIQQETQERLMAQYLDIQTQQRLEKAKLDEMRRLEQLILQAERERKEELKRQYEEEKRKALAAIKARQEAEERRRKLLEEAERKRRREEAVQRKLQDLGVCPVGYRWVKQSNGYRCAGGFHFIGNGQLGI